MVSTSLYCQNLTAASLGLSDFSNREQLVPVRSFVLKERKRNRRQASGYSHCSCCDAIHRSSFYGGNIRHSRNDFSSNDFAKSPKLVSWLSGRKGKPCLLTQALGRGPNEADDHDAPKGVRASPHMGKATKLSVFAEASVSLEHLGMVQSDASEPSWTVYNTNIRIAYSMAMYGGLALAGSVICSFAGVDFWGGFHFTPKDFLLGLLFSLPPICFSTIMHQDCVVDSWPPARAIRDAEDEQLVDFFIGMRPWQITVVATATACAEELFFRSAVQGGLAHAFQLSGKGVSETTYGIASLTGIIPPFGPFAQALAAVLTGAITGSMFYVLATPKDPQYVIAPVVQNGKSRREVKKRVEVWFERRMLRKIYTPLVEALMSLYFGCVWLQVGNLMVPVLAHACYYTAVVAGGVRRFDEKADVKKQRRLAVIGEPKPGNGGVREVSIVRAQTSKSDSKESSSSLSELSLSGESSEDGQGSGVQRSRIDESGVGSVETVEQAMQITTEGCKGNSQDGN